MLNAPVFSMITHHADMNGEMGVVLNVAGMVQNLNMCADFKIVSVLAELMCQIQTPKRLDSCAALMREKDREQHQIQSCLLPLQVIP